MKTIKDDLGLTWRYLRGKMRLLGTVGREQGYFCNSFNDGVTLLKRYGYIS